MDIKNMVKNMKTEQQPKKQFRMDTADKKPTRHITKPKKTAKLTEKRKPYLTNLKISNTTRNGLRALIAMQIAKSQKDAVDKLLESYYKNLSSSDKTTYNQYLKMLNTSDIKYNKF